MDGCWTSAQKPKEKVKHQLDRYSKTLGDVHEFLSSGFVTKQVNYCSPMLFKKNKCSRKKERVRKTYKDEKITKYCISSFVHIVE